MVRYFLRNRVSILVGSPQDFVPWWISTDISAGSVDSPFQLAILMHALMNWHISEIFWVTKWLECPWVVKSSHSFVASHWPFGTLSTCVFASSAHPLLSPCVLASIPCARPASLPLSSPSLCLFRSFHSSSSTTPHLLSILKIWPECLNSS